MPSAGPPAVARGRVGARIERTLLVVGVIALGFNLRAAITSLPPVFPELQSSLHLSAATISLLAATPVICFGVVSGFAAALARRLGDERALLGAVIVLIAGLVTRGAVPAVLLFRIATFWLPIPAGWVSYVLLQRRGIL